MKKLTPYRLIIFLSLATLSVKAQINVNNENIVLPAQPIEQINIQTDRNIYLSGEKVWFKAYCFNKDSADYHISKILYLELFDHSREISIKHKFKIRDGISHGAIELPENIPSGTYFLRAYTQLLRNYPPESYTTLAVSVINPLKELPPNISDEEPINFEIITENGILIDGINSDMALRFYKDFHLRVNEISIVDNLNNAVANFKFVKNNLGIFNFTPLSSNSYFLKLIMENNDTIMEALPIVKKEGIAIKQISSGDGRMNFNILKKSHTTHLSYEKEYSLEIISGFKQVISETKIKLTKEENEFSIAKDELETGMHLMVLKDLSGNTVSNYPFIVNSLKNLPLKLYLKQQFKQREKVNLGIELPSMNSDSVAELSVAIVKKGTRDNFPSQVIDNFQLLNSYCKAINPETLTKDQLGILRMYYWKMILKPDFENKTYPKPVSLKWLPDIKDVSISGVISQTEDKQAIVKTLIYLSVLKNNPQLHITKSRNNGEFIFSLNNLEGNQDIFLCPIYMADNGLEIKINSGFSSFYPATQPIPLSLNHSDRLLLKEMLINQQSNDLFNITKPKKLAPFYQNTLNIKSPHISVLLKDFIDLNSMETVFREIIPNCLVRKRENKYLIQMADATNSFISDNPLILIDNLPVFDVNELFKVHPSKIEKIEVNPTNLILGDNIIQGLIRLTTNTNNFGGIEMPKGSTFLEYQTISPSYQFESPAYETMTLKSDRSADFRTTLYWNPALVFTGKSNVSFYTSDHCSEYEVIVNGMDSDGNKYFGRTSFEVIKNQ